MVIEVVLLEVMMKKLFLFIGFIFFFFHVLQAQHQGRPGAQDESDGKIPVMAEVHGDDTLIIQNLSPVVIFAWKERPDRKTRILIRNVKKVYPYARLAGIKLRQYNQRLMEAETKRERRKLMKQAEQELKEDYGDDLRKLTFSQGHILLKLIDRETGDTSYELVEELRGKFKAFFWQSFARIFGFNLKRDYDPDGKDKKIEDIVLLLEQGKL